MKYERTALYRLYDTDGQLLYVGITNNVKKRWRAHEKDKAWWSEVTHKTIEWFETRKSAERVEKVEIEEEEPLYNRALNPNRRLALPTQSVDEMHDLSQGLRPPFYGVAD